MGVLFKYFSASSDEVATSVIDRLGGPGSGPPFPMPYPQYVRLHGIEAARELTKPRLWQASETGLYIVDTKGFDPVADLGEIEETLTGTDFETLLHRPRHGEVLAERDDGAVLIITISDELQSILANAATPELTAAATQWLERRGQADERAILAHLLGELSALARGATERNERLYCWSCL
jgi:hypothetical protein